MDACFSDHLYGIRPIRATIIGMLHWNWWQISHPKWIQAVSHFNNQCKSCLCWSRWPWGLTVLTAWLLRSRVRISLRAWVFVPCLYMLCCP